MSTAYILFNGIQYPFPVVDAAISWAMQSNGRLVALFIHATDAAKETYPFPSDLNSAEKLHSADEAVFRYKAVIESNVRMLENEARRHNVPFESKVLIEPADDELAAELADAAMLFASNDIEEQGALTVDSLDWQKHLHDYPSRTSDN